MNILDKRDRSLAPIPTAEATDKATKYRWARPTTPGEMLMVNKMMLNLDGAYQRDKRSEDAVRKIAREWDWTLFGVLKVARRADDSLWVFDGGHRLRASFYRSDIHELPCIIFHLAELSDEARAFIAGAKLSHSISSFDTFHAATVAQEPGAVAAAALLQEFDITVKKSATRNGELKCIHTIQRAVEEDVETTRRVMAVCVQIASDQAVSGNVFRGMFRLARHFNGRDVLTEYADTLASLTQQEVEKAIRQLRAEVGKGGETIDAKGIINLLNKGKRTRKLVW